MDDYLKSRSRRTGLQQALGCALALSSPPWLRAATHQPTGSVVDTGPINVTLTGLAVSGAYRVLIETVSAVLRETYPGSSVTVKPSTPAGGLQMVADRNADITFAAGTPELRAGTSGAFPFTAPLARNLGWLCYVHSGLVFFFVADKTWADRYGIRTLADLAQKKPPVRVGNNRKGNLTVVVITEEIFKANGFTSADIDRWGGSSTWVPGPEALQQLADGKVDLLATASFLQWANLEKLASSRDLVWLGTSRESLQRVADAWEYDVMMIPKGTYNFIREDQPTINEWVNAIVGLHVPDVTVMKVLAALRANTDRIRALHPTFHEFTPQGMARKPTKLVAYHPAAERFYRNAGLI